VSAIRRVLRESPVLRALTLIWLLVVAGGAALLSWGALSNLWADYRDSPTGTYVLIGLAALAVCVAALAAAVRIGRHR
jgi:hypothetical protein